MGIDYDGGMIVGDYAENLDIPNTEELEDYEWIEENDLDEMYPWYDAPLEECIVGYCVSDVKISDMDDWLKDVKEKAKKFKELFGKEAKLIGTQNIW